MASNDEGQYRTDDPRVITCCRASWCISTDLTSVLTPVGAKVTVIPARILARGYDLYQNMKAENETKRRERFGVLKVILTQIVVRNKNISAGQRKKIFVEGTYQA
jgi:hypothetical protein